LLQGHGEAARSHDFGKAPTLLSILKSKARRTLGIKLKTRTVS
jgi:HNH endonuclease